MSTYLSTAAVLAMVLRTTLLTLHFVSLPHALDPHTGHFVHLHEHADEESGRHEPPEARPEPGIWTASHSCLDSGVHDCPYNHFLHQPSSQSLCQTGALGILPPFLEPGLPDGFPPFIREDLHLLAPMNSPPA